jgi:hypothetical protein
MYSLKINFEQKGMEPVTLNNIKPDQSLLEVILNADDPQIAFLGKDLPAGKAGVKAKVTYFGIDNKKHYLSKLPHAMDSLYCPNCQGNAWHDREPSPQ